MMRVASIVLVLAVMASASPASQFEPFTRESQVRSSEAVVVGRVIGLDSYWTDDRAVILTDVEVEIEETWKGSPPRRIVVQTLGGTVGDVLLHVDGAATFRTGERVVLFLERYAGSWVPTGMRFGKYDLSGSGADVFAVGSLPPGVLEAGGFDTVSIALADLRAEVLGIVGSAR